jgi:adenylate cyclase
LDDIFVVQSEIAEKVAGELQTRLLPSEKRTLEKKPTENIEAYSNFLRGRELLREGSEASLKQAVGLFEKAIELDPEFARAYVGVADCHMALAESGQDSFNVSLSTAKTSLDRGLNLDPNLPEAHASLSGLFFDMDDIPGSETEARRALELNPSLPDSYRTLFEVAALKRDPAEMVRQVETAYRLDPIQPHFIWLVGEAYLCTGRGEEALEHWKKTAQLAPAYTYRGMMDYYLAKGELERAKEFHAKAEKLEPTNPRITWMGGVIAALEGDREKALLVIRRIEDAKMGEVRFNYIGYVCHALGDLDSYFEYMNKALETHAIILSPLMYSPLFAKARADPRYSELVGRLRRQTSLMK